MEPVEAGILGEYLNRGAWDEAEMELTLRLSAADTPERAAFLHHFLATLHKLRLKHAVRRGDLDRARHFRRSALAAFRSAAALAPRDVVIRVGLAEFIVKHTTDPADALGLLGPFAPQDFSSRKDETYQDHKRLVWRGTALLLMGASDAGAETLEAAYGSEFSSTLPGSFNTGLWLLIKRGVRLPGDRAARLAGLLRDFPLHRPANVDRIEASLRSGPTQG